MLTSNERKMVRVDLQDGFRRRSGKACPACGAGASRPAEASPTVHDYIARAVAEQQGFERDGWGFDLTHADTKRFVDTADRYVGVDDLVFIVALVRA